MPSRSGSNAKIKIYEPVGLTLADSEELRYTELGSSMRIQDRQLPVVLKFMNRLHLAFTILFFALASPLLAGSGTELQPGPSPSDEEKNSTELFAYETVHTFDSNFKDDHRNHFGDGDSTYNDISYSHRFLITGNWYFRLGAEYERFDFGGTNNGLPDHLQTIHALVAYEYIFKDHAGAGIEIDPGPYFQNDISGDSIDVP